MQYSNSGGALPCVDTKNYLTQDKAKEIITETIATFPVAEIGTEHVQKAIEVHGRYGYSYWDSLVIATALLHGSRMLYSEDLQHNQLIWGRTQIINPFL
ncbi:MAG: PIN domain-containing protein [bacterium]|nr:PIN domain-containing protein [bacterium]